MKHNLLSLVCSQRVPGWDDAVLAMFVPAKQAMRVAPLTALNS